jgi:8-oxo-dGTP diphosphatase
MITDKRIQEIVATAFIHRDGKLFIARRAVTKRYLPGVYELPGGHIEFGETMEKGLAREIMEEFHINVIIGEPFNVFTYTDGNETRQVIEVNYFATLADPYQHIDLNPEDHSEFRWIGQADVKEYFTGNERELIAATKGFRMLYGDR